MAKLRRDGFFSVGAGATEGTLQTRTVTFTGNHLFVNADTSNGQLLVEALDENGNVLPGFSKANCNPLRVNKTLQEVNWSGGNPFYQCDRYRGRRPLNFVRQVAYLV